ncbi:MAG TPA: NADH-quinone oxidoreductase subunit C [Trebonia sp.]|nr:NADH-quinone oxidoreductase subunit C [Trebonia sp.]
MTAVVRGEQAPGPSGAVIAAGDVTACWQLARSRIAAGQRFAGLFATGGGDVKALSVLLARPDGIDALETVLPPGATGYPALTPHVGAAFWYERVIHDLAGLVPHGHPRLAPLVRPGSPTDPSPGRHVEGYGLFTIPHGPVRSGVLESMEYLVETPGEAIPHLNMRIFYKHRGIAGRFTGLGAADGVLLAERAEGIASVAHALAYCHAIESIAGCTVPAQAARLRVVHAELERVANHLDAAARLCDASGLAVATARLALHKERVLRLVSGLCGSRFCRGVIVPGGVSGPPAMGGGDLVSAVGALERAVSADAESLMGTSSFLDRLRGTGPLTAARAREHGALGPVGKACGYADDARVARPYDAYPLTLPVSLPSAGPGPAGDALARLHVRWEEIGQSFDLIRAAATQLRLDDNSKLRLRAPCDPADGRGLGWAEAPQGEVIYDVTLSAGRIVACQPRSPSFHNLVLMHEVFQGDILTDFPFIEASFGLSVAGAAL